jgi:hypothetical protein
MKECPPEAYLAKPWPALQCGRTRVRFATDFAFSQNFAPSRYVTDMQNNINDRLGLQVLNSFFVSHLSPNPLRLSPLQQKTPLDVLKRLAALTRHTPHHTPTATPAIKASAVALPPHDVIHASVASAAAAAALTAALMRGLSLLRRR